MSLRLANRIAIVTGSSSGLGKATALRFAAAGARVVCADLHDAGVAAEIQEKYGVEAAVFVSTTRDRISVAGSSLAPCLSQATR